jgi:hypothetical protein
MAKGWGERTLQGTNSIRTFRSITCCPGARIQPCGAAQRAAHSRREVRSITRVLTFAAAAAKMVLCGGRGHVRQRPRCPSELRDGGELVAQGGRDCILEFSKK